MPLKPDDYVEAYGNAWAEPDLGAAASRMRAIVEKARTRINSFTKADDEHACDGLFAPTSIGRRYQQRLIELHAALNTTNHANR